MRSVVAATTVLTLACFPSTAWRCVLKSNTRTPREIVDHCSGSVQGEPEPPNSGIMDHHGTSKRLWRGGCSGGMAVGDKSGLSTIKRFSSLSAGWDGRGRRICLCLSGFLCHPPISTDVPSGMVWCRNPLSIQQLELPCWWSVVESAPRPVFPHMALEPGESDARSILCFHANWSN